MFSFEIDLLRALESLRTPFLDFVLKYISMLGRAEVVFALFLIIYYVYNTKMAYKLVFMASTSLCVNNVVKNFVKLERPFARSDAVTCVDEKTATGYSFPSGHSQGTANYTFGFALQVKKKWAYIVATVITVIVAFSRLYLGCHYLTDIVVGLILGLLVAFLCDKLSDKFGIKKCMVITSIIFIPFLIYFLFVPEELFADLYKGYGFLLGGLFAYILDEKIVHYEPNDKMWKRIVKLAIAALVALGLKAGLKVLFGSFNAPLVVSLILDLLRYTIVVFSSIGLCPLIFKKLKF